MHNVFDADSFFQETNVPRETMDNIRIYAALLKKWQKKINLVAESTMPDIWSRHFYDSFQLKPFLEGGREEKIRILDIGSGAGFPALLLSMLDIGDIHMVESNGKKCAFLRQVIRETKGTAVVHNQRVESMDAFPVDYITARACASLTELLDLGQKFIGDKTIGLFLKGQSAEQEIAEARQKWTFDVEKHTSATDPSGVILKVSHIGHLHEENKGE